jgi:hypothetical protein
VIPAGTAHKFWNPGDDVARFLCEVRPALQFERLIETMFGLAAAAAPNKKGVPNPLQLAGVAHRHFDEVRLPFPPAWLQRLGLALPSGGWSAIRRRSSSTGRGRGPPRRHRARDGDALGSIRRRRPLDIARLIWSNV